MKQEPNKTDARGNEFNPVLPTVFDLKRGDKFKSKLNGKIWEVYETSLGKRVKLISGNKNEDYYLHMFIGYVMKAIKKGYTFKDSYILLNGG